MADNRRFLDQAGLVKLIEGLKGKFVEQDKLVANYLTKTNLKAENVAYQNTEHMSNVETVQDALDVLAANVVRQEGKLAEDGKAMQKVEAKVDANTAAIAAIEAIVDVSEGAGSVNDKISAAESAAKKHADNQDAILKQTLQAEIDADVKVEKERAEGQEAAIREEFAAADEALEGAIQAKLDDKADQQSLEDAIAVLQDEIDEDVKVVADALADEKNAAKDGSLAKKIADEVARADAEEKDIRADFAAEDAKLQKAIDDIEASLADGAAAQAIEAAKDAADAAQADVDAVEKRLDEDGGLVDRLEAVEAKFDGDDSVDAKIAAAQEAAEKHADDAITALVDSAPDAMNTLNELAKAINDNQDVYDAYVEEHATAMATMKSDLQKEIDDDVKVEADRAKGEEARIEGLVTTEKSRAEGAEGALAARLDVIEGEGTGSVKKAQADAEAKAAELDAALKKELQDEIDADVKVVADELAKQKDAAQEGTLANKIAANAAFVAAQPAIDDEQDRRLGILEGLVVGGEGEGIQKVISDVAANATAIEKLNGAGEGSVAKAVADAVAVEKERAMAEEADIRTDFAAADAQVLADAKADAAQKVADEVTRVDAKIAEDIAVEADRAKGVEAGFETRIKANEDAIAAINNAETGILKSAKDYTDTEIAKFVALDEDEIANAIEEAFK